MCEKLLSIYNSTSHPRHRCCTATTKSTFTFITFFTRSPLSPQLQFTQGLSTLTPMWGLSAGSTPKALPDANSRPLQVSIPAPPAPHSPRCPAPQPPRMLQGKGAEEQSPSRLDTSTQGWRCPKLQFKSSLSSEHHDKIKVQPQSWPSKARVLLPPRQLLCTSLTKISVTIQRPKGYLLSIYYNFFLAGFSM